MTGGVILGWGLTFAMVCIGVAMLLNIWRLVRGPTPSDRILALDTLTINSIALIVLFGVHEASAAFFEAALLLAMVGFLGTVAFSKFILRGDIIE